MWKYYLVGYLFLFLKWKFTSIFGFCFPHDIVFYMKFCYFHILFEKLSYEMIFLSFSILMKMISFFVSYFANALHLFFIWNLFLYEICFYMKFSYFHVLFEKLSYETIFLVFGSFSIQMKMISFLSHPKVVLSHVSNKTLSCYFLQNHFLTNWRGVLESNNKPDFGNLFWGKF